MKLRSYRFTTGRVDERGYEFWCIGCNALHRFPTCIDAPIRPRGAQYREWSFDGDYEKPTVAPAITTYHTRGEWVGEHWVRPKGPPILECQVSIKHGRLEYSTLCAHELAGHTIDMWHVPETREETESYKRRRLPRTKPLHYCKQARVMRAVRLHVLTRAATRDDAFEDTQPAELE